MSESVTEHRPFPADFLNQAGINRQHVFDLADLPRAALATLGDTRGYAQLILLGHGGRTLWERVKASGMVSDHPIDDYCIRTVSRWFAEYLPDCRYRILYPGEQPVGLQQLGKLAGWHQPSPFMVGIDSEWGSWFAYRAAILADSRFSPFFPVDRGNPCLRCQNQPCLAACPADALSGGQFALDRCSGYRLSEGSACATTCLARESCPVGAEHRYDKDQLAHSYGHSLAMIRQFATKQS